MSQGKSPELAKKSQRQRVNLDEIPLTPEEQEAANALYQDLISRKGQKKGPPIRRKLDVPFSRPATRQTGK